MSATLSAEVPVLASEIDAVWLCHSCIATKLLQLDSAETDLLHSSSRRRVDGPALPEVAAGCLCCTLFGGVDTLFPCSSIKELLRLNWDCLRWGILTRHLAHCVFHTG